jgi:hypothetical protein
MINGFCVILSKYRFYQGIALYQSLEKNYLNFKMFILCVDDETFKLGTQLNLDNAILIKTEDLREERLKVVKESRRLNEYCWTLKPFFIDYVLDKYDFLDNVVYLDADLYFFNDPSPIFLNNKNYCVLLSEHDYEEKNNAVEEICGKYNSGFMIFKNCKTSIDVLKWWQEKCIDWCYDGVDNGRFGDQKYLEFMPQLFEGIYSISTPGVNIAPWNEDKYIFSNRKDKVYINGKKLICYHYCGLRLINKKHFALLIGSQIQNMLIHPPYVKEIKNIIRNIDAINPEFDGYQLEKHFQEKAKVYKIGK